MWLSNPHTQKVLTSLSESGHQALFVGGCVRNALLGVEVNDIDIATNALPQDVIEITTNAGLHAIPTGIDHGTVTVIANGIPHEITTFRKDILTDGRHAKVIFSNDIHDDARRRDFTMNALYAMPDGTVVDPLNGIQDLRDHRVRFIEDASQRIQEDYLRILRFFRFHAWYGDETAGIDPEALHAISSNLAGIETLSKERIGAEMLKLLAATNPAPALASMRLSGALGCVLVGADDRALAPMVHLEDETDAGADSIRRLACLGGQGVSKALRLSKKQAKSLDLLRDQIGGLTPPDEAGYRFGFETGLSIFLLRAALLETPLPMDLELSLRRGANAQFPVKPADLMPDVQGVELGQTLRKLEAKWVKSGFKLDRNDLLA
ncbi:CCA tRNA nucleotidyltransferase [Shimia litoralis]|uniref:CCA tRNA nucleotidyltransferase n=2 Tax=Shimia litoralis TaxID=420403 RepID=A0A4V6F0N6_9RHOB|nr:CCA tRNA nucleotidyltransferase [Shimia litoralis]